MVVAKRFFYLVFFYNFFLQFAVSSSWEVVNSQLHDLFGFLDPRDPTKVFENKLNLSDEELKKLKLILTKLTNCDFAKDIIKKWIETVESFISKKGKKRVGSTKAQGAKKQKVNAMDMDDV